MHHMSSLHCGIYQIWDLRLRIRWQRCNTRWLSPWACHPDFSLLMPVFQTGSAGDTSSHDLMTDVRIRRSFPVIRNSHLNFQLTLSDAAHGHRTQTFIVITRTVHMGIARFCLNEASAFLGWTGWRDAAAAPGDDKKTSQGRFTPALTTLTLLIFSLYKEQHILNLWYLNDCHLYKANFLSHPALNKFRYYKNIARDL